MSHFWKVIGVGLQTYGYYLSLVLRTSYRKIEKRKIHVLIRSKFKKKKMKYNNLPLTEQTY